MSNQRYEKHFNAMKAGGWDVNTINSDALVDENIGQFFIYWPHNNYLKMGSMAVDRYAELIRWAEKSKEDSLRDATSLAIMLENMGHEGFDNNNSLSYDESDLFMINALYMSATKTGITYQEKGSGLPFAFLTIMYPADAEHTTFVARPVMLINTKEMSVNEVNGLIAQVMVLDAKSPQSHLLKYIKK
jgi:hypothetical protein